MNENRRVYRGEQSPATPGHAPSKGLFASIVGRKTASYTVTPPSARRAIKPGLPRPPEVTLRERNSSFKSSDRTQAPCLAAPDTIPPSASSSTTTSAHPVCSSKRPPAAPILPSRILEPHSERSHDNKCQTLLAQEDSNQNAIDEARKRHVLMSHRRSTSLTPSGDGSQSSLRSVLPQSIISLQRPLASVEALIKASYSSLSVPEPPRLKRSSSWISPPTLLQSSNRLIQKEVSPNIASDPSECYQRSSCDSDALANDFQEPHSRQGRDDSVHSFSVMPSLPPVGDQKRTSRLQRSHSYADCRPDQPLDKGDNGSLKFDFNSASLGRPVKPKHNLSLQENVLQYKNWLQETPKGNRGHFMLTNFKKAQNKKKPTSAAAVRNSTVVKTIATTSAVSASVQRAEEDVKRALRFYKDTVLKQITEMLPGSATVVFDMVVCFTRAVDDLFPEKGPRLCEVERALNLALANLVRWSDRVLLQEPHELRETSVHNIVTNVEDATQALADLARQQQRRLKTDGAAEEISDEISNTPAATRTPPSYDDEILDELNPEGDLPSLPTISTQSPSPTLCRRLSPTSPRSASRLRDCSTPTSRPSSHPSSTRTSSPSDSLHLPPCDRLSHSLSSDSIIRTPESGSETCVGSPVLRDGVCPSIPDSCPGPPTPGQGLYAPQRPLGCSQSVPPPLPPKQRSHIRSNSSSPQYHTVGHSPAATRSAGLPLMRSVDLNQPLASGAVLAAQRARESVDSGFGVGKESSSTDASADGVLTLLPGHNSTDSGLRLSSASITNTSSPSQMSPASSLDSFNHDNDGMGLAHMSEDMKLDLASSVAVNCASADYRPQSYSHIAEHFGHLNIGMNGSGRSESVHIFQSHNYSRSKVSETHVLMESSSSVCYTQQLHRSSASYIRSSTSSSSSTLSSGSEGDTNSLTNVHSLSVPPQLPAKTRSSSANSPLGTRVLDCDGSPDVPPKKCSNNTSIQTSVYSGSNSSMQSNSSSNSSNSSGYHSITSLESRRHTIPESTSVSGDEPPPIPPKKTKHVNQYVSLVNRLSQQGGEDMVETQELLSVRCASFNMATFEHTHILADPSEPKPALPPKQKHRVTSTDVSLDDDTPPAEDMSPEESLIQQEDPVSSEPRSPICAVGEEDHGVLEELQAVKYILYKNEGDDGPLIRGGTPDALLVHACAIHTGALSEEDRAFQTAFVRTYRTFMTTEEVVDKLLYRYHKFSSRGLSDRPAQAAAGNAFSLLVCVVKELVFSDMEETLLQKLSDFQYELLSNADFNRAKLLRKELVFKLEARKLFLKPRESLASLGTSLKKHSLLDFKAYEIAEQLTILDEELFKKVELPEALIWSREQSEDGSPNLTQFTEHFNNMSFWVRTKILEQGDAREREKYVRQFIKILKHLRKINNFNSYLALLSALDSAPIRRLEWQKSITDGLKEYCALIDSSSSFRAYRNALAESKPPCIPYIGLILQDLTFVNIGNSDLLPDGRVNFTKRWQQSNVLENLSRFRKERYNFKRNETIITFFKNFEDAASEDTLWEISKMIKPSNSKRCN